MLLCIAIFYVRAFCATECLADAVIDLNVVDWDESCSSPAVFVRETKTCRFPAVRGTMKQYVLQKDEMLALICENSTDLGSPPDLYAKNVEFNCNV